MSWLNDEPPLAVVLSQQSRRMLQRASRRPVITAALGVGLSIALLGLQMRRPRSFTAEVGMLVTEGAFDPNGQPRPTGELRTFITTAAFSTGRLEEVISRHDLVSALKQPDMARAVTAVRQATEVEISQDYFRWARSPTDPPRSARVRISFSAPNEALAEAVARDLAELVAETRSAREIENAEARLRDLQSLVNAYQAEAARLRAAITEFHRSSDGSADAPRALRIASLRRSLAAALQAGQLARSAAKTAEFPVLAGRGDNLARIAGSSTDPAPTARRLFIRRVVVAVIVGVPLALVLIGALDPTVRDEQDVRRAGLMPLGRVPTRAAGRDVHPEV